jgi:very-short-patch-repair endonuclease
VAAKGTTVDRIIERIASRSHGVVTRRELLDAGVSRHEIEHRLRTGSLIRTYRGVFRVGHRAPSLEASYVAAVRACGERALLAGRAAGHFYGLARGAAPPPEVLAPGSRRVSGIRVRQTREIDPRDATVHRGIPITSLPRTLVDLAGLVSGQELAGACHEAGVRYGTTPKQVRELLDRRRTSRGAGRLRRILDGDDPITISKLERNFLELVREAGLPLPVTNKSAGGRRVDCRWPEARLTVEIDGYRYHRSRHAWERDRLREREARARGDEFRRYTWADVHDEPQSTVAELRRLLVTAVTAGRTGTAGYRRGG